jgi:sec-independent protein translocase protein TatA
MSNIGWAEIAIVVVLLLIVFGPKKLPELGASLGKSIRGFKKGLRENKDEIVSTVVEVREATGIDEVKSTVAEVRQAVGIDEVKSTITEIRDAANIKDALSVKPAATAATTSVAAAAAADAVTPADTVSVQESDASTRPAETPATDRAE